MPAQQAIDTLRPVLAGNPAVNVLVASEPGQETILQRLNLRQDLANEFRSVAKEAQPEANVILRPYDPGYTPEWNELAYIELQGNEDVANMVEQISEVQEAEIFHERDEIVIIYGSTPLWSVRMLSGKQCFSESIARKRSSHAGPASPRY